MHSKNSDRSLSAFQISEPILVSGANVLMTCKTFEVYSNGRNIEGIRSVFHAPSKQTYDCIRAAFDKHSECILTILSVF